MRLSIVTTLYQSAQYVEALHSRLHAEASRLTDDFEIIFVNDGSTDGSLAVAIALVGADRRLRVIDLSRNFGQHKAMMTGLAHARGELIFLIDGDLEEPPELLGQFYRVLQQSGADVVYGVQESRKGDIVERITGNMFYTLFNLFSTHPLPRNIITARLMTQRYVASLVSHRERELFLAGLWVLTGFEQVPVTVKKASRGNSSYTFARRVTLFVNAITAFSSTPLVFIFYLGCAIVSISAAAALYLVCRRLFFGVLLAGWPSLIVSVWLLGGVTIFCIGVLGIYLSRIFSETKERPYTIVRDIHGELAGEGARTSGTVRITTGTLS